MLTKESHNFELKLKGNMKAKTNEFKIFIQNRRCENSPQVTKILEK